MKYEPKPKKYTGATKPDCFDNHGCNYPYSCETCGWARACEEATEQYRGDYKVSEKLVPAEKSTIKEPTRKW